MCLKTRKSGNPDITVNSTAEAIRSTAIFKLNAEKKAASFETAFHNLYYHFEYGHFPAFSAALIST